MKNKNLLVAGTLILILLIGAFALFWNGSFSREDQVAATLGYKAREVSPLETPYVVPEIKRDYENKQFRFRLGLPEGFKASELSPEENGSRSIVLQDAEGNGIQILVTPFPDDIKNLTAEMVKSDIPDMQVSDAQTVEIGDSYRGVAFISNNEAFGGASREVWFVFRGNLYQISTYARLDNLLQAMFGSWQFF